MEDNNEKEQKRKANNMLLLFVPLSGSSGVLHLFSAFNKLKQVTAFSVAELVSTKNPKIFIFNTGTNTDVVLFDVTIKLRIIAFIIWM